MSVETGPIQENPNREIVAGLRALANFLEDHPEENACYNTVAINFFPTSLAEVAKRGYGHLDKATNKDDWFYLRKQFGPQVYIDWNKEREKVCRRVVTGSKITPAQPELIIPATPEKVEEVWEWECPDSILRDDQAVVDAATDQKQLAEAIAGNEPPW